MKQHLCRKHAELVKHNPYEAQQLWYGAFNHGVAAFRGERWREAEQFLGIAWSISTLRFAMDMETGEISVGSDEFASAARFYSNVLCRLGDYEAAETCLRYAHDGLLHWSFEQRLPFRERHRAYRQLPEFRQRTTALLTLNGRSEDAKCLEVMAKQLSKRAAQALLH